MHSIIPEWSFRISFRLILPEWEWECIPNSSFGMGMGMVKNLHSDYYFSLSKMTHFSLIFLFRNPFQFQKDMAFNIRRIRDSSLFRKLAFFLPKKIGWNGDGMVILPFRNGNGNAFRIPRAGMGMGMHSGFLRSEWEWECIPKIPGMDRYLL